MYKRRRTFTQHRTTLFTYGICSFVMCVLPAASNSGSVQLQAERRWKKKKKKKKKYKNEAVYAHTSGQQVSSKRQASQREKWQVQSMADSKVKAASIVKGGEDDGRVKYDQNEHEPCPPTHHPCVTVTHGWCVCTLCVFITYTFSSHVPRLPLPSLRLSCSRALFVFLSSCLLLLSRWINLHAGGA